MDLKQSIKGRTNQSIDLVSAISDASKKAEDLGVDMAKNNDVQRLQNRIDEIKEMFNDIAKMKKDAESEIKKLR
jgi:hypothetical protein